MPTAPDECHGVILALESVVIGKRQAEMGQAKGSRHLVGDYRT